jgi:sodium transport system ATP-binding protein
MIQIQNVTKQYQLGTKQKKELQTNQSTIKAVSDVSFICKPGRVFSLLGPNGAGKTTLLRMIATILTPTAGNIIVEDADIKNSPELVRSKIGFLTGSTNLYERLTPEEIVKYYADLHGMEKEKFNLRKKMLFDQLNINDFASKKIGQLSTGMKQKVSIARSIIHNPGVVVFDEPTSGLDVITAHSIIDLIKHSKEEGKTIIFSSHIMSEVDLLCDDLAIINKGKLIYNDSMVNFRKQSSNQSLTEKFIQIINSNSPAPEA